MARYPRNSYGRRRGPKLGWLYIVIAVVIFALAVVFLFEYDPFARTESKPAPTFAGVAGGENAVPQGPSAPVRQTPPAQPALETPPEAPEPEPSLPEVTETPAQENPDVARLVKQAEELLNARPAQLIKARNILNEALLLPMSEQQHKYIRDTLSDLADKWLFSRLNFPQDPLCETYKVQPGDLLEKIGKTHKVPWEIIAQINGIPRPEALRAGTTIKVINGPFHAIVDRSDFRMDLYLQNTFVRSFRVGLGKPGYETPTGLWVVAPGGKLVRPSWTDPDTHKRYEPDDPNYPLGSRWIGLKGIEGDAKGRTGFAIHGTVKPEEIGTAGSRGCIRLHNGDVILVYNLMMPGYSQVKVVE